MKNLKKCLYQSWLLVRWLFKIDTYLVKPINSSVPLYYAILALSNCQVTLAFAMHYLWSVGPPSLSNCHFHTRVCDPGPTIVGSHIPRLQWVIQGWLFSKLQYLEWSLIYSDERREEEYMFLVKPWVLGWCAGCSGLRVTKSIHCALWS